MRGELRTGTDLGADLCDLVGIDPNTVTAITVRCSLDDPIPVVEVVVPPRRMSRDGTGQLRTKEYSIRLRRRGRLRSWWRSVTWRD